jgi:hypothetical protein
MRSCWPCGASQLEGDKGTDAGADDEGTGSTAGPPSTAAAHERWLVSASTSASTSTNDDDGCSTNNGAWTRGASPSRSSAARDAVLEMGPAAMLTQLLQLSKAATQQAASCLLTAALSILSAVVKGRPQLLQELQAADFMPVLASLMQGGLDQPGSEDHLRLADWGGLLLGNMLDAVPGAQICAVALQVLQHGVLEQVLRLLQMPGAAWSYLNIHILEYILHDLLDTDSSTCASSTDMAGASSQAGPAAAAAAGPATVPAAAAAEAEAAAEPGAASSSGIGRAIPGVVKAAISLLQLQCSGTPDASSIRSEVLLLLVGLAAAVPSGCAQIMEQTVDFARCMAGLLPGLLPGVVLDVPGTFRHLHVLQVLRSIAASGSTGAAALASVLLVPVSIRVPEGGGAIVTLPQEDSHGGEQQQQQQQQQATALTEAALASGLVQEMSLMQVLVQPLASSGPDAEAVERI